MFDVQAISMYKLSLVNYNVVHVHTCTADLLNTVRGWAEGAEGKEGGLGRGRGRRRGRREGRR